jgi:Potential Queuosine, Q, salvage protein family
LIKMPDTINYQRLILDSAKYVSETALHVRVCPDGIERLATALEADAEQLSNHSGRRDHDSHLFYTDEEHAQWLFILDSLNFSFWADEPGGRWQWPAEPGDGQQAFKGAIALGESFRRAQLLEIPITDAGFLASLEANELLNILGGRGVIPMLEERCSVLNETGRVLKERYGGQIVNLLEESGYKAANALDLIWRDFPSFRDSARLDGREIFFLKRAQIFLSDLWLVFGGETLGQFDDIDTLTAFSDYKLPQLLRTAGALVYEEALASRIDNYHLIAHGSREEVEIRALTVHAVELLRARLESKTGLKIFTCLLDNCLWWLSQSEEFGSQSPHHRTRTIYY